MDGRVARGARTRAAVANRAASVASLDGLSGMTLGRVAEALGIGKSGIQAAYRTKEELQIAAVAAATAIFVAEIITPTQTVTEGRARLMALVDAWLDYIRRRVLPGGCFMGATLAEFDSHPGPVRDALARARRGWLRTLEQQIGIALERSEIVSTLPPAMVAFEIDALLAAANVARNLTDTDQPLTLARTVIVERLRC